MGPRCPGPRPQGRPRKLFMWGFREIGVRRIWGGWQSEQSNTRPSTGKCPHPTWRQVRQAAMGFYPSVRLKPSLQDLGRLARPLSPTLRLQSRPGVLITPAPPLQRRTPAKPRAEAQEQLSSGQRGCRSAPTPIPLPTPGPRTPLRSPHPRPRPRA